MSILRMLNKAATCRWESLSAYMRCSTAILNLGLYCFRTFAFTPATP